MEPPAFGGEPPVLRAGLGASAAVHVPLTGTPPFQYEWSRAGASLDDRFTVTDSTGGVRLTVTSARSSDSGVYTLQASNAAGRDTARVRLEVSADEAPSGDDPPTFLRRLQDLTVKVGTRTRFLVEIVSSTECKVTWYRNERRLMEAERVSLVRDGNFWCADVAAVSVDDAGRWTCAAENSGGRASCSAHLNVLVPKAYKRPEFVEELRALLTEQGTVSLECKVVGVPTPVLRWFKDSREIKAGDVFALTASAEDPTSLGTYTCEAVNCMGRAYSSSKVHVTRGRDESRPSSAVTPEPPPIFTKELEDQFVKICDHLTLGCHIVVPPWPRSVVWYNKEGKVDPSERYHVTEDGVGGYLLEVQSAEWPDEGEWKCVATSAGGRVGISTCHVIMDVPKNYRKPRFMENLQAVLTEEGLVSFECKVVGFPTPVLSWFKDGQELKPGDVYQLTGTNSLGSYCCIARNCMGQASSSAELTVEDIQNQLNEEEKLQLFSKNQAPKFVHGLKSVEAKIDEPFRFTIKVAIPPEPSVLWYRDDQPVDESPRCHLAKEDRGVFNLDIQNLEFLDQAEWKCVAMNDYGHSVTSCFLKLIIPRHYKKPRFLENLQAILSEEGAVNLECKVIGVPQPVLKWYKDGEELKPGDIHRIISGQDGTCCLGTYTCEAQNCMGIAASSASLLGFDDSMKAKKKIADEQALQRNLSLSTIHEERTSQMYDTPVGDITLDDKGEISFSFDGKEVSVSLYETPDLTEEEALQIVEMYADQLSENVTEHNVVELPPLRFVKETSTSGNLLMEAIIIDVSPEYFASPEEDLRTEADVEDISIADENGPPQLSLDTDLGEDYLEKTMALLSDEKSDIPKKLARKKSDSLKSGEDFFSLSREQSISEDRRDDDTQMISESDLASFASARSYGKINSKSSKRSVEDGRESSETKTILHKVDSKEIKEVQSEMKELKSEIKEVKPEMKETEQKKTETGSPVMKQKRERRSSRGSRRSSSGSEKSYSKAREELLQIKTEVESKPKMTDEEFINKVTEISSTITKAINDVQIIERDIILKSELMSSAATASRSLEIISSLISPLSEIHSIADAAKESKQAKEVSTIFNNLPQSMKALQQSLTLVEKCIDMEGENKTLVKKTCVAFIETCGNEIQKVMSDINSITMTDYLQADESVIKEIQTLTKETTNVIKYSSDTIKTRNLLSEASEIKTEETSIEAKHLKDTQKAVFELRSPLNSLLCIAESADSGKIIDVTKIKNSEVILNDMSASIQDLQAALEQIESLSVKESTTSLNKYNTEIIETVMDSILKLRISFEQLSTETKSEEDKTVLKHALTSIKQNLSEISSHIDKIEGSIGRFDILQSDNKLEVLQKMAQILIALENNLPRLETLPNVKSHLDLFHKNLTKVLENVIETNEAKKYFDLIEICDVVNRVNAAIKTIDSDSILSLASLNNTLRIVQDHFVNNIFDSELNCAVLSNITDILVDVQEAINQAEEISVHIDSEHVVTQDISSLETGKANIALQGIEHTIAAISKLKSLECAKELKKAITPVLENIQPVLEELKRSVASIAEGRVEQDENVSEMSDAKSIAQILATPLCELNQNIVVINQTLIEQIENLKENSEVFVTVAEPLYELHTTLETLQQVVISQYGEDVTPYEVSVNMANAVQNLQSCIVMIREHGGIEIADEMSTLEDISGIKTTADTLPSDRLVLPEAAETTAEQAITSLNQEVPASATAQALQSLNDHITVLQTPDIIDALDTLSEVSDYSSLKSVVLGLGDLHSGIQEILHPFILETSDEMPHINTSKLMAIAEPMQDLQQCLSVLDATNIPIYEHILEMTTDKIHSVFQSITEFKENLDKCIRAVFPAMETADKTIEISNKVETLRTVCEHLKVIIDNTKAISAETPVKQEVIALEKKVNNLLDATDVSKGIRIEQVKSVTQELYENVVIVQEELIQFTTQAPEKLAQEAKLIQIIDKVERNIAVLEEYDFVDLSRAFDMSCASPQIALEIETDSLLQMDDVVQCAVGIIQDSSKETPEADLMIVEDFFKNCKNEFALLHCLLTKKLSHKRIIRLLQEFNALKQTINDFKVKQNELHLAEDISNSLTTFFSYCDECLSSVQESLIKIVDSQSNLLFKAPIMKLDTSKEVLSEILATSKFTALEDVARRFINIIEIAKPCLHRAESVIYEEIKQNATFVEDKALLIAMDDAETYIEEQILTKSELTVESRQILQKVLDCIQKHHDYKDAVGTGKTLILLKCLAECSDILQENMSESKSEFKEHKFEDTTLKMVLAEMLVPLQALNHQLLNVQEQVLTGGEDDVTSIDLTSTESFAQAMGEIQQDIKQLEQHVSEGTVVDSEEKTMIMELDKEIHTIQDSIKSIENVKSEDKEMFTKPMEEIEKSLQTLLAVESKAVAKGEAPDLLQNVDKCIELIEIVEEISTIIKIDKIAESAKLAKELRDGVASIQTENVEVTKELSEEIKEASKKQASLAMKLKDTLISIQAQVMENVEDIQPELKNQVVLQIEQAAEQLQDFIKVDITEIKTAEAKQLEISGKAVKTAPTTDIIQEEDNNYAKLESKDIMDLKTESISIPAVAAEIIEKTSLEIDDVENKTQEVKVKTAVKINQDKEIGKEVSEVTQVATESEITQNIGFTDELKLAPVIEAENIKKPEEGKDKDAITKEKEILLSPVIELVQRIDEYLSQDLESINVAGELNELTKTLSVAKEIRENFTVAEISVQVELMKELHTLVSEQIQQLSIIKLENIEQLSNVLTSLCEGLDTAINAAQVVVCKGETPEVIMDLSKEVSHDVVLMAQKSLVEDIAKDLIADVSISEKVGTEVPREVEIIQGVLIKDNEQNQAIDPNENTKPDQIEIDKKSIEVFGTEAVSVDKNEKKLSGYSEEESQKRFDDEDIKEIVKANVKEIIKEGIIEDAEINQKLNEEVVTSQQVERYSEIKTETAQSTEMTETKENVDTTEPKKLEEGMSLAISSEESLKEGTAINEERVVTKLANNEAKEQKDIINNKPDQNTHQIAHLKQPKEMIAEVKEVISDDIQESETLNKTKKLAQEITSSVVKVEDEKSKASKAIEITELAPDEVHDLLTEEIQKLPQLELINVTKDSLKEPGEVEVKKEDSIVVPEVQELIEVVEIDKTPEDTVSEIETAPVEEIQAFATSIETLLQHLIEYTAEITHTKQSIPINAEVIDDSLHMAYDLIMIIADVDAVVEDHSKDSVLADLEVSKNEEITNVIENIEDDEKKVKITVTKVDVLKDHLSQKETSELTKHNDIKKKKQLPILAEKLKAAVSFVETYALKNITVQPELQKLARVVTSLKADLEKNYMLSIIKEKIILPEDSTKDYIKTKEDNKDHNISKSDECTVETSILLKSSMNKEHITEIPVILDSITDLFEDAIPIEGPSVIETTYDKEQVVVETPMTLDTTTDLFEDAISLDTVTVSKTDDKNEEIIIEILTVLETTNDAQQIDTIKIPAMSEITTEQELESSTIKVLESVSEKDISDNGIFTITETSVTKEVCMVRPSTIEIPTDIMEETTAIETPQSKINVSNNTEVRVDTVTVLELPTLLETTTEQIADELSNVLETCKADTQTITDVKKVVSVEIPVVSNTTIDIETHAQESIRKIKLEQETVIETLSHECCSIDALEQNPVHVTPIVSETIAAPNQVAMMKTAIDLDTISDLAESTAIVEMPLETDLALKFFIPLKTSTEKIGIESSLAENLAKDETLAIAEIADIMAIDKDPIITDSSKDIQTDVNVAHAAITETLHVLESTSNIIETDSAVDASTASKSTIIEEQVKIESPNVVESTTALEKMDVKEMQGLGLETSDQLKKVSITVTPILSGFIIEKELAEIDLNDTNTLNELERVPSLQVADVSETKTDALENTSMVKTLTITDLSIASELIEPPLDPQSTKTLEQQVITEISDILETNADLSKQAPLIETSGVTETIIIKDQVVVESPTILQSITNLEEMTPIQASDVSRSITDLLKTSIKETSNVIDIAFEQVVEESPSDLQYATKLDHAVLLETPDIQETSTDLSEPPSSFEITAVLEQAINKNQIVVESPTVLQSTSDLEQILTKLVSDVTEETNDFGEKLTVIETPTVTDIKIALEHVEQSPSLLPYESNSELIFVQKMPGILETATDMLENVSLVETPTIININTEQIIVESTIVPQSISDLKEVHVLETPVLEMTTDLIKNTPEIETLVTSGVVIVDKLLESGLETPTVIETNIDKKQVVIETSTLVQDQEYCVTEPTEKTRVVTPMAATDFENTASIQKLTTPVEICEVTAEKDVYKAIETVTLVQHIEDLTSASIAETVEVLSKIIDVSVLKESIAAAQELKDCFTEVQKVTTEDFSVEQAKLVEKLQGNLEAFQAFVVENTENIAQKLNASEWTKIDEAVTHLRHDLARATVTATPTEMSGESMQHLETLLHEVADKILTTERSSSDTDSLRDNLDEIQTVIIKLKRDYDGASNDTLNETLEDLECSVRSVQLQINEDSPPELLKEACATLQLLVNNMSATKDITGTVVKEVKTKRLLKKCSSESEETVKLLDMAIESKGDLSIIIDNLNILRDVMKLLRNNFLTDEETIIDKGVEIIQSLDQVEEKVFALEKDVGDVSDNVKERILNAMHSVFGSISNMRSTIQSIQKIYMHDNYGKPSKDILKAIKNINDKEWKTFSKSIRKVLNHFEDIKFYINFDKTARLPSDAAFTKIILNELKISINETVKPYSDDKPEVATTYLATLRGIESNLSKIESLTTLEVKQKIPIFKEVAALLIKMTEAIAGSTDKVIETVEERESAIENEKTFEDQQVDDLKDTTFLDKTQELASSDKTTIEEKEINQELSTSKISQTQIAEISDIIGDKKEAVQVATETKATLDGLMAIEVLTQKTSEKSVSNAAELSISEKPEETAVAQAIDIQEDKTLKNTFEMVEKEQADSKQVQQIKLELQKLQQLEFAKDENVTTEPQPSTSKQDVRQPAMELAKNVIKESTEVFPEEPDASIEKEKKESITNEKGKKKKLVKKPSDETASVDTKDNELNTDKSITSEAPQDKVSDVKVKADEARVQDETEKLEGQDIELKKETELELVDQTEQVEIFKHDEVLDKQKDKNMKQEELSKLDLEEKIEEEQASLSKPQDTTDKIKMKDAKVKEAGLKRDQDKKDTEIKSQKEEDKNANFMKEEGKQAILQKDEELSGAIAQHERELEEVSKNENVVKVQKLEEDKENEHEKENQDNEAKFVNKQTKKEPELEKEQEIVLSNLNIQEDEVKLKKKQEEDEKAAQIKLELKQTDKKLKQEKQEKETELQQEKEGREHNLNTGQNEGEARLKQEQEEKDVKLLKKEEERKGKTMKELEDKSTGTKEVLDVTKKHEAKSEEEQKELKSFVSDDTKANLKKEEPVLVQEKEAKLSIIDNENQSKLKKELNEFESSQKKEQDEKDAELNEVEEILAAKLKQDQEQNDAELKKEHKEIDANHKRQEGKKAKLEKEKYEEETTFKLKEQQDKEVKLENEQKQKDAKLKKEQEEKEAKLKMEQEVKDFKLKKEKVDEESKIKKETEDKETQIKKEEEENEAKLKKEKKEIEAKLKEEQERKDYKVENEKGEKESKLNKQKEEKNAELEKEQEEKNTKLEKEQEEKEIQNRKEKEEEENKSQKKQEEKETKFKREQEKEEAYLKNEQKANETKLQQIKKDEEAKLEKIQEVIDVNIKKEQEEKENKLKKEQEEKEAELKKEQDEKDVKLKKEQEESEALLKKKQEEQEPKIKTEQEEKDVKLKKEQEEKEAKFKKEQQKAQLEKQQEEQAVKLKKEQEEKEAKKKEQEEKEAKHMIEQENKEAKLKKEQEEKEANLKKEQEEKEAKLKKEQEEKEAKLKKDQEEKEAKLRKEQEDEDAKLKKEQKEKDAKLKKKQEEIDAKEQEKNEAKFKKEQEKAILEKEQKEKEAKLKKEQEEKDASLKKEQEETEAKLKKEEEEKQALLKKKQEEQEAKIKTEQEKKDVKLRKEKEEKEAKFEKEQQKAKLAKQQEEKDAKRKKEQEEKEANLKKEQEEKEAKLKKEQEEKETNLKKEQEEKEAKLKKEQEEKDANFKKEQEEKNVKLKKQQEEKEAKFKKEQEEKEAKLRKEQEDEDAKLKKEQKEKDAKLKKKRDEKDAKLKMEQEEQDAKIKKEQEKKDAMIKREHDETEIKLKKEQVEKEVKSKKEQEEKEAKDKKEEKEINAKLKKKQEENEAKLKKEQEQEAKRKKDKEEKYSKLKKENDEEEARLRKDSEEKVAKLKKEQDAKRQKEQKGKTANHKTYQEENETELKRDKDESQALIKKEIGDQGAKLNNEQDIKKTENGTDDTFKLEKDNTDKKRAETSILTEENKQLLVDTSKKIEIESVVQTKRRTSIKKEKEDVTMKGKRREDIDIYKEKAIRDDHDLRSYRERKVDEWVQSDHQQRDDEHRRKVDHSREYAHTSESHYKRDDERRRFADHSSRDYTSEFARPSNYREKTYQSDNFHVDTATKGITMYKAQTLVLDAELRSSVPPRLESSPRKSEPTERRLDLKHKTKAVSEARSILSEKRSSLPRDVKRKPVFSTYLTDRTAVEGSRVKLTCSVLSSAEPTITWYKNGVLIDNKLKYRTKFVDGLVTLEVLNAVPADSAEYNCTVENENGSVSTTAILKVYPSFEASPIPPTFTRSIRDTYHLAENELVLECRIRGQPLPSISWLKDDRPVVSDHRYQAYYLADGVCRLAIGAPTPEDSGKYTCKAENSVWSDQITHVVSFTGKETRLSPNIQTIERSRFTRQAMESRRPHFTNVLTDYKVASGGTIGLQVEVRGCPTRVEWLREGKSVTDVYRNAKTFVEQGLYTLALSDVTEKESGLYTCRAWSMHGNVDMNAAITVVHPAELDGKPAIIAGRPEKDVLISVGEDLNISFRVQGEPKPKVVFMKGTRDITNSQRVCKMTSDDYVKFTVKRSVISDAGTYCILARNAYGCDRAFVTVVVRQRASSENLISDWTYPLDDSSISVGSRNYDSVPRIPSEPSVVDGGNNWVSLAWPKPDTTTPVLAYKVESWLLGKEGGARWTELGITPRNSFDIFNLKQGEQYHFRVTLRNRYGWGESVQTSTPIGVGIAGDRPEFVEILPGQLKVLIGQTANLTCSVKGKPTPEVVWMKNGHEIEEDSRVNSSFNGYNCSLVIKDIKGEDEARYSCEATNEHGRSSTYARLAVVTDRLVWEADAKLKRERSSEVPGDYPPQFTMRLRDRRVQATYPVRLTCQVVGCPTPTVTWYKDGEEVYKDNRHTHFKDELFHTLEIAPTTLEDGGVYECTARNSSGAVSCRCCLVVDKGIRAYVAPEMCCGLEPLYRLREGDELRISAVVEAYPSVGVTWYRDGVRLRPSRRAVMTLDRDGQIELALAFVTSRDAGVYTCTASNEVGSASTSGKVEVIEGPVVERRAPPALVGPDVPYSKEPMFIRKPRSSEAFEGDTVIIECEVTGDPKPDVYWLRDFLKPDYYRDATHFKRVGAGPEYRFEIPHAKLDYTGAYSVVARNVHGEAKAIISLQILVKDLSATDESHNVIYGRVDVIPRFERNLNDLLSYDGDAVEFECQVSGNPEPDIRWYHYAEVIRDCPYLECTFEEGAARLKIKQVTADDEGTYTCEASNNLGKTSTSACLVVYPPGEPNTLSQRLRRPPALLSAASTPRSTPRSTPARSVSRTRTPGPEMKRLSSPSRQMPPSFYTYPFNKVVEEGETAVFQCAVKGLPSPWATWDKDGIIVTPSTRITIKEKEEIRMLEIEHVTIEDVGLYRICVENDYGRAEGSARLEVITQKGKFYAGVRAYSASPRRSAPYRKRCPSNSKD